MEKLSKEDYVALIANATPLQLVIINYKLVLHYLDDAKNSIEDTKAFEFAMGRATDFLNELKNSLDMSYEMSHDLMALYNYVSQELSYYLFNKNEEHVNEAEKVLNGLLEGWTAIEKDEKDKTPLMENTQQLYAGLTYNKSGKLSEYIEPDAKRGFKA